MPLEINYDESGNPKTVVLSYVEYQSLLAKPDENVIVEQTASKITELIQQFIRYEEPDDMQNAHPRDTLDEDEFTPSSEDEAVEEKPAPIDVRRYKNATGYYDAHGFRIIKGSKASGYPSDTFQKKESASRLRENLIARGILARERDWGDYTFIQDYLFNSPSAAACIVDGNSRSGPEAWGKRKN